MTTHNTKMLRGSTKCSMCSEEVLPAYSLGSIGTVCFVCSSVYEKLAYNGYTMISRTARGGAVVSKDLPIDQKFHRNVLGSGGAFATSLQERFDVVCHVPSKESGHQYIRIAGMKGGVDKAIAEIVELVSELELERSTNIVAAKRLHSLIIGEDGAHIRRLRGQYPGVRFHIPHKHSPSDKITLYGEDEQQLSEAERALRSIVEELSDRHFLKTIPVTAAYHGYLAGAGGKRIGDLQREYKVRLLLREIDNSHSIEVSGQKSAVLQCAEHISTHRKNQEPGSVQTTQLVFSSSAALKDPKVELERRIFNAEKKLKSIESLEERHGCGEKLELNQLEKMKKKGEVMQQISKLRSELDSL